MEALLSCSPITTTTTTTAVAVISATTIPIFSAKLPRNSYPKIPSLTTSRSVIFPATCCSSSVLTFSSSTEKDNCNQRWMVLMEAPPRELTSKPQIIDYYVTTLASVLGRMPRFVRIYDASCHTHFGFCCDIEEETAQELAGMPGVLSVKPELDDPGQKDYSKIELNFPLNHLSESTSLFPFGTTKHWLVRMDRPAVGVIRKAPVVDYYVLVLTRVLGNEKDAQLCIYHMSWESNHGFCCVLDDQCAQELTGVPGVLSVCPDENFGSDDKDYGGDNVQQSIAPKDSAASTPTSNIKTKKLFITGLSFYTSEKTLRAAFEGFGEIVEVKIIMDKISKRSKGYGFVEYTTEEATSASLREMNGKIVNGWMITVDVAKTNPPKYSRGQPRFAS